jgi:hypothetical protein
MREKGEETHEPRHDGASFSGARVTPASMLGIGAGISAEIA